MLAIYSVITLWDNCSFDPILESNYQSNPTFCSLLIWLCFLKSYTVRVSFRKKKIKLLFKLTKIPLNSTLSSHSQSYPVTLNPISLGVGAQRRQQLLLRAEGGSRGTSPPRCAKRRRRAAREPAAAAKRGRRRARGRKRTARGAKGGERPGSSPPPAAEGGARHGRARREARGTGARRRWPLEFCCFVFAVAAALHLSLASLCSCPVLSWSGGRHAAGAGGIM